MTGRRIVFMGTPDFAVPSLLALVREGYSICGVVSQPDRPKGRGRRQAPSPVKQAAIDLRLPVVTVESVKSPAFLEQISSWRPEAAVVVAFGQILPQPVLDIPTFGCINVHASLLPAYRGAAPIHWAIIRGETETGVTTMLMDRGMDTGDMLLQEKAAIGPDMTMGELHDELSRSGAELLVRTLDGVFYGRVKPTPQNHAEASYAPMLSRPLERIDWKRPAVDLHNLVRGMNPWPGAYCMSGNLAMKIWRTKAINASGSLCPGRIHSISPDGLLVETGCGMLELLEVQPECKRRMGARDCVSGYCLMPGTVLE